MLSCKQSPPGRLLLAIRQFNNRDWFECHETLEELWVVESGEVRDFLQGFIQIAVALHHWRNNNHGGAVRLLKSGVDYLAKVSGVCLWVDVAALIADADRLRAALETLDTETMTALDQAFIPLVKTASC